MRKSHIIFLFSVLLFGSCGKGNEAGSKEQTAQDETGWNGRKCQTNRGVDGSHLFGCGCKGSCQNENPKHLHHSRLSRSFCQTAKAFAYAQPSHDEKAVEAGCKESNRDGNGIEIVCRNTQKQVEQQKYKERTQRNKSLFSRNRAIHAAKLHIFRKREISVLRECRDAPWHVSTNPANR